MKQAAKGKRPPRHLQPLKHLQDPQVGLLARPAPARQAAPAPLPARGHPQPSALATAAPATCDRDISHPVIRTSHQSAPKQLRGTYSGLGKNEH